MPALPLRRALADGADPLSEDREPGGTPAAGGGSSGGFPVIALVIAAAVLAAVGLLWYLRQRWLKALRASAPARTTATRQKTMKKPNKKQFGVADREVQRAGSNPSAPSVIAAACHSALMGQMRLPHPASVAFAGRSKVSGRRGRR